jgi:hypothetical protein
MEQNDIWDSNQILDDWRKQGMLVCRVLKECSPSYCRLGFRCHVPFFTQQRGEPEGGSSHAAFSSKDSWWGAEKHDPYGAYGGYDAYESYEYWPEPKSSSWSNTAASWPEPKAKSKGKGKGDTAKEKASASNKGGGKAGKTNDFEQESGPKWKVKVVKEDEREQKDETRESDRTTASSKGKGGTKGNQREWVQREWVAKEQPSADKD